jgi:hypothetical protein
VLDLCRSIPGASRDDQRYRAVAALQAAKALSSLQSMADNHRSQAARGERADVHCS